MTKNADFEKIYLRLMRAAQAGDPRARQELMKLQQAAQQVRQLTQLVENGAPAPTISVEGEAEAEGEEDNVGGMLDYSSGDALEVADRLLRGPLQHVDSLEAKALIMRHRDAAQDATAPRQNVNPPSAANAVIGNQATPDARFPPIEVARWSGEDSEATNFTITAGFTKPPGNNANNGNVTNNTFLVIQWGVRAYTFNMEVDIGTGVELTLTGSFCIVQVATDPGIAENVSLPLIAGIAFRQGNRTTSLTRTKRNYAGGAASVTIPPFAKKFFVVPTNSANTVTISLQEPDGTVVSGFTVPANALPSTAYIIPPGATILNFQPSAGFANIVFELNV